MVALTPTQAKTTAAFKVRVLGPFELELDGVAVDTARWQRRVASLFKYIVAAPGLHRLRDEAIDTFWPDAAPETGSANLRLVAYRLRVALGSDVRSGFAPPVISDQSWIALSPLHSWDVDLHHFEELARQAGDDIGALQAALALYRGEPLAEERYEDWAMPVREHVERLWRETSLRLATLLREGGFHDEALTRSELLLEHDPIDEEALRVVLTALYRLGRRTEALRRYHQFEQHLADELGILPSPETVGTLQQLDAESPHPTVEVSEVREHPLPIGRFLGALPEGPLVARDHELERIQVAADLAATGAGRLVLLEGERGSGKTRLAQETMLRLRERGFVVLTARCHEHLHQVPLSLLAEMTHSLEKIVSPIIRPEMSATWPSLGGSLPTSPAEQQRLMGLIGDLLATLSEQHPMAVLIDDLHWADPASLALVQLLARRAANRRVLLLATYWNQQLGRDHPVTRTTLDLVREGLVERVPIYRLSMEATAAMVHALLGDMEATEEFVEFVYRKTRGNPFFIDRMLQALGGQYSLVRQIAVGGMGRVFEAVDSATGEPVAVKIMFARTEADPKALQRFEQEGRILASFDHPNIVRVHGTYLDEFTNAIVMELLEGVSLGDLMREGRLPLGRIRALSQQVTAALACAHEHGVVHRDVKPDNIMVLQERSEAPQVKVTDFGIARLVRPKTSLTTLPSTGITMGTPLYLAPEQIEGHRVDGHADIYSLGAVLYHAVTGEPPFTGDDPLAIALKHVHQMPVPPRTLEPTLPPEWEALILRALAKSPADRFPSVLAMGEALAALPSEPLEKPVPSGVQASIVESEEPSLRGLHPVVPSEATTGDMATPSPGPGAKRPLLSRRTALALGGAGVVGAVLLAAVLAPRVGVLSLSPPKPATTKPIPSSLPGYDLGTFNGPSSVSVDASGKVYATDQNNGRVEEFAPDGKYLRAFGTKGRKRWQFQGPTSIAVQSDGTILVADYGNARIQRIARVGKSNVRFLPPITFPQRNGKGFASGSVVIDSYGNIYKDGNRITKTDKIDQGGDIYVDGHRIAFNSVAIDSHGNIYASALYQDWVVKFDPSGKLLTFWGAPGRGLGQFYSPAGIAPGPGDRVYVADVGNHRIQVFTSNGAPLRKWGGEGSSSGRFNTPQGVAVDAQGRVYVADTNNSRIQEYSATGQFRASFGTGGKGCGEMISPSGVDVDHGGNIYVSDYYNNRIDKFSPSLKPLWYTAGTHPHRCNRTR